MESGLDLDSRFLGGGGGDFGLWTPRISKVPDTQYLSLGLIERRAP
jgi:hypothetical protein